MYGEKVYKSSLFNKANHTFEQDLINFDHKTDGGGGKDCCAFLKAFMDTRLFVKVIYVTRIGNADRLINYKTIRQR